jgi:hypothetical protein
MHIKLTMLNVIHEKYLCYSHDLFLTYASYTYKSTTRSGEICLGYGLDDVRFDFPQGQDIFLFSKTSRTALMSTQLPIPLVSKLFPRG